MAEKAEKAEKEHLPVSEFLSERSGPLSPFGEDVEFPLPADKVLYVHPSAGDKPNSAGR